MAVENLQELENVRDRLQRLILDGTQEAERQIPLLPMDEPDADEEVVRQKQQEVMTAWKKTDMQLGYLIDKVKDLPGREDTQV